MGRRVPWHKLVRAAVTVHLAIVAFFALPVPWEYYLPQAIDRPLTLYGGFTAAHSRHDYFAPAVPSQARAEFLLVRAEGPAQTVRLTTPSGEANRRLGVMFTLFAWPGERERLMQAWGDYVMRLDPGVIEVRVRVEVLAIPTMREAAAGKVASWIEVGRATVRRADGSGG